jgi:hypothetical protein
MTGFVLLRDEGKSNGNRKAKPWAKLFVGVEVEEEV